MNYTTVKETIISLLTDKVDFETKHKDGRINSTLDENTIANLLKEHFGENFVEAPPRKWWDCQIYGIPCNIKSTTGGTDNAGNYLMLRHILNNAETSSLLDASANKTKDIEALEPVFENYRNDCLEETDKNYLFIVALKTTGEIFVRGLKEINTVYHNPSNLPFQINWKKEMELPEATNRTMKELVKLLLIDPLSVVQRSFEVRTNEKYKDLWNG